MDYCELCGREAIGKHHLIFGSGMRPIADNDRIYIRICNRCHTQGPVLDKIHDNPMAEKLSKMLGQVMWERNYLARSETDLERAREEFMKRYGRAYL